MSTAEIMSENPEETPSATEQFKQAMRAEDPAKALNALLGNTAAPSDAELLAQRDIRRAFEKLYLAADCPTDPLAIFSALLGYSPEEDPPGVLQMADIDEVYSVFQHSRRVIETFSLPHSTCGFLGNIWLQKKTVSDFFERFIAIPPQERKAYLDDFWAECDLGKDAYRQEIRDPMLAKFVEEGTGKRFDIKTVRLPTREPKSIKPDDVRSEDKDGRTGGLS